MSKQIDDAVSKTHELEPNVDAVVEAAKACKNPLQALVCVMEILMQEWYDEHVPAAEQRYWTCHGLTTVHTPSDIDSNTYRFRASTLTVTSKDSPNDTEYKDLVNIEWWSEDNDGK